MALPITYRAIVVASVACHVIKRVLFPDTPSGFTDNDRDLALEIELRRLWRHRHTLVVTNLRIGKPQEKHRLLGNLAIRLAHMLPVIRSEERRVGKECRYRGWR